MKALLFLAVFVFPGAVLFGQGEVVSPLLTNPSILKEKNTQMKIGNSIDSTFVYEIDTLEVPANLRIFDDFSTDRFVPYNADYTDGNVTSALFYHLMDPTNITPQNPGLTFCDSSHAHRDTVSVIGTIGTTTTYYFTTPNSVWVNDLGSYPVNGMSRTLYQECYVVIDSIIDGVPDPDTDTVFYAPDFVQDSARVFTVSVTDSNLLWVDHYVYRNNTYAIDPWSLGVATFDGVGADGWPYDWGTTSAHEQADVLTSRPINLAGSTPGSVWLTFIFQAKGRGNAPEANDSLILDFWIPDSGKWKPSSWYVQGGIPNDVWDTAHIAIPFTALDNGFRFRFRNWATTSGNLDHWHIDYVMLYTQDDAVVDVFHDLAVAEPVNTLLKDYTAVPWDHYKNVPPGEVQQKMVDTTFITAFNSSNATISWDTCGFQVFLGGVPQSAPFSMGNPSIPGVWDGAGWPLGISHFPFFVSPVYAFSQAPSTQAHYDVKMWLGESQSISNTHPENDTNRFTQKFDNFYAFDDGSAEAAYGITGSHGLLAYKFEAYEADTLAGVLMHFVPSVDDVSTNTFLLTIWDDNGGVPGTILYQDDYFNTHHPEYSGSVNGFKYYTFQGGQEIAVPQIFYVGWEQIDEVSLNVGMDLNIDNGDKIFRNVTGAWQTSAYDASLLIRPVFSTALDPTLAVEEEVMEELPGVTIFPNPAQESFRINGVEDEFTVTLFDISGRVIRQISNETVIDVSDYTPGLYIVDIRDQNGLSLYSGKLIKD